MWAVVQSVCGVGGVGAWRRQVGVGGLQMQLSHRGQGFSQSIQGCMCSEQGLPSSGWTVSARLYICLKAQAPQALGPVVLPDGSSLSAHVLPVTPSATALCLPPWPLC